jgi:hypothetical protein
MLMVGGCGLRLWLDPDRRWTEDRLERAIAKDLPPGSDRPTVEAWLDRRRLPHTWSDSVTTHWRGMRTMPELAGLRNSDLSGMLVGELQSDQAKVDLFFAGELRVFFFFDKQGRCVGHYLDPFVIMP